ncbi:hypothetical protein [Streptomyces sp. DvalAA-14]|uniref:hypothetical protein n=2 Tax=unclassified Streptomyces TaxID=2593676 RepID=UPI00192767D8|nr:hypothetical protein [Streptomyces sp. SID4948]
MTLPGARGAALVEWISGLALGRIGEAPGDDHEEMAAATAEFARSAAEHPVFTAPPAGPPASPSAGPSAGPAAAPADAGRTPAVEDIVVTTPTAYHLLRFVEAPYEGGLFLHLWLDRGHANLALSLLRMRELAHKLVLA